MSVEDRLARLEHENRRLKVTGLLAAVVAASVLLMGQTRPTQRIEAETFAVKDRRGVVVAALGVGYDVGSDVGLPWLAFYNADGSVDTFLQVWHGTPSLQLAAPGGGSVILTAQPDGEASVRVYGSNGRSTLP